MGSIRWWTSEKMLEHAFAEFTIAMNFFDSVNENEKMAHPVILSEPFYMGKYEVTQEVWQRLMGNNPSYFKGPRLPVNWISWENANKFCSKIKEVCGLEASLPTEAQWEYACRAGTNTALNDGSFWNPFALVYAKWEYPFPPRINTYSEDGSIYCVISSDELFLDRLGWFALNHQDKPNQVGLKQPNAWGLYDMHGNIEEWCWDRYGAYPNSSINDPVGPPFGSTRVLRGGDFLRSSSSCRSASRYSNFPYSGGWSSGFRVILYIAPRPK
jgi:formylglycine-generating enzyme required for sulfatase activity